MFTKNNIVYSEAGKVLVSDNNIGYELPASETNIREEDVVLDDMQLVGKFLVYSNGKLKMYYRPRYSHADWKTEIIGHRYTKNDQIALILNKEDSEEDATLFQKMQEWRAWSSTVARKIMSLK